MLSFKGHRARAAPAPPATGAAPSATAADNKKAVAATARAWTRATAAAAATEAVARLLRDGVPVSACPGAAEDLGAASALPLAVARLVGAAAPGAAPGGAGDEAVSQALSVAAKKATATAQLLGHAERARDWYQRLRELPAGHPDRRKAADNHGKALKELSTAHAARTALTARTATAAFFSSRSSAPQSSSAFSFM